MAETTMAEIADDVGRWRETLGGTLLRFGDRVPVDIEDPAFAPGLAERFDVSTRAMRIRLDRMGLMRSPGPAVPAPTEAGR